MGQTAQGVHVATTFLQNYLNLIDQLLEDGRFHEATQHCRHILKQFPRHIPTYRALAKALLEQHLYADALDIFHRVLSADPNDFIAHVGLSLIHREEGRTAQAIWHMERAFEMEPYNNAIQQELQTLYRQTSKKRLADSLPLTRRALAHLYFRSELYSLAVAEVQAVQAENGDPLDLDVLLAEALWRNGQRVEAVNVCLRVLDKLPNCIPVNAILGEIWLLTGRVDEARTYLGRLQDLTLISKRDFDPETAVGRAFRVPGAPLLPDDVEVEALDLMEGDVPAATNVDADWADGVDESDDDEIYSWLNDLQIPSEAPGLEKGATDSPSDVMSKTDWFQDEMPTATASVPEEDWLAELDDAPPFEEMVEEPTSSAAMDMADFNVQASKRGASLEEMPDWLLAATGDDEDLSQLDVDSAVDWMSLDDLAETQAEGGGTDWFSDPTQEKVELETDWFKDDVADEAATLETEGDLDWLGAPDSGVEPGYLDAAESADWLVAGELANETAVPDDAQPDDQDDLQIPAWLMTAPLAASSATDLDLDEADENEESIPQWLMTTPLDALPADMLEEAEETLEEEVLERPDVPADEFDWLFAAEEAQTDVEEEPKPEDEQGGADSSFEEALKLEELSDSPGLVTGMLAGDQEEIPDWLLSSDLGEPALEEDEEEDDSFIEELFGSLTGAIIDDTVTVSDGLESPEDSYSLEQLSSSPEMMTEEEWVDAKEEDEAESGELPSWLFGTTLGDSDELTSPTGDISLTELAKQPLLATDDRDEPDLPDWFAVAEPDSVPEPRESLELPEVIENKETMPEDDQSAIEILAATGITADTPLAKRGSGLLDWLSDEPIDTGEMEAVDMADKDEMAQPVPEMPEDKPTPGEAEDAHDWLQELAAAPGPQAEADDLEPAELPDWIQDLSQTGPLAEEESADALLDELLDEEQRAQESVTGATEMLDWLQDETAVSDEGTPEASIDDVEDFELDFGDDIDSQDTSMLWLDALATSTEEPEETHDELADAEEPDLSLLDAEDLALADLPDETEPATAKVDALSWLDEMASEPGDMIQDEISAEAEEALDWLADLETADTEVEITRDASARRGEEEADQGDAATADAAAWLADLATDSGFAESDEAPEESEESLEESPFQQDELQALGEEALELDDLMTDLETEATESDWLADLATDSGFAESDEAPEESEKSLEESPFQQEELQALGEEALEFDDLLAELETEATESDWLAAPAAEEPMDALDELSATEEEKVEIYPELTDEAVDEVEDAVEKPDMVSETEVVSEADSWLEGLVDFEEDAETEAFLGELLEEDADIDNWLGGLVTEVEKEASVEAEMMAGLEEEEIEPLGELEAETPLTAADDSFDWATEEEEGEEESAAAWLDSLADGGEVDIAALTAELDETSATRAETAVSAHLPEEEEDEDVLGWLGDLAAETADEINRLDEDAEFDVDLEPQPTLEADEEFSAEETLGWLGDLAEDAPEVANVVEEGTTEIVFPEDAMFPRDVGVPTDVPEELDDTMAWLAELAAEQGVSLDDLEPGATQAPDLEAIVSAAEDAEEPASAEIDDAMAWLEHLAAEQGAPVEPLPTVADRALAEISEEDEALAQFTETGQEEETAVSAAEELHFPEDAMFPRDVGEPTDVPEELDEAMDWLHDLMAEQGLAPTLEKTADDVSQAGPEPASAPEPVLAEVVDTDTQPEDEVALALDWLEEIALVDAAKVEIDSNIPVVDPAASDLFAALDWVEQQLNASVTMEDLDLGIDVDEIPEDPEQALAWLAGMAEEEEPEEKAISDELETAVPLTPTEEELIEDIPDDPDAAMAWLEQLSAEQDTARIVDETVTAVPPEVEIDTPPEAVVAAGTETEIIFPEDAMFPRDVGVPTDVPAELDDTMDWLEDLMAEQGLSMEELDQDLKAEDSAKTAVPLASQPPEQDDEAPTAVAELTEDGPEPDLEAMFATQAETQLAEPPKTDEQEPPDGMPHDEISAQSPTETTESLPEALQDTGEINLESLLAVEDETATGGLGWLDDYATDDEAGYQDNAETDDEERAAPDAAEEQGEAEAVEELGSEFDINAELAESWPEWLNADQEQVSSMGETGWLKSFGETDVSSWLSAEDEVMSSGIFEDITLPETGPLRSAAFDVGEIPEVDTSLLAEKSDELSFEPSFMSLNEEQLQTAREAANQGNMATAVDAYKTLIESGQGLGIIIADLETAVQDNPKEATIRRLLGDAYMRNGQLQKALDTYRQALDQM